MFMDIFIGIFKRVHKKFSSFQINAPGSRVADHSRLRLSLKWFAMRKDKYLKRARRRNGIRKKDRILVLCISFLVSPQKWIGKVSNAHRIMAKLYRSPVSS
ncbi:hypothetical protein EYC80_001720 [Monilinia laxa]|uniref:Uncharacterized protein n=1 Tax=Monilinia laxa TaxID=61186 RepID=A0A5N6K5S1_MONLA|nr:hypothetical protein EYC80_001720 [Monilinia laxa]